MSTELMMPSNYIILCGLLLLLSSVFPASGSFPVSLHFASSGQSSGASASVFPMNIQGLFPLGLTGLISLQSEGLLRVFSSTTIWKHQFSVLSLLYGPTLTSVHEDWQNHSLTMVVSKVLGFNLWVVKIPWRRKWQPTPVYLPGKSHGKRSLAGYSSWDLKELDTS